LTITPSAAWETTLGFCRFTMGHEAFRTGAYDTHFVRDHYRTELLDGQDPEEMAAAAAVASLLFEGRNQRPTSAGTAAGAVSAWKLKRR
jgi:acetyl-CoA carboxylase, biotin carboxylase subunit